MPHPRVDVGKTLVNEGAIPLVWYGHLRIGYTLPLSPTSYTRDTVRRVGPFFYHFSEHNTLVVWRSCDFRLYEGGILWGEQSFTAKEEFKKVRRPIANRQCLYQLIPLSHFLPSWCYRYNPIKIHREKKGGKWYQEKTKKATIIGLKNYFDTTINRMLQSVNIL